MKTPPSKHWICSDPVLPLAKRRLGGEITDALVITGRNLMAAQPVRALLREIRDYQPERRRTRILDTFPSIVPVKGIGTGGAGTEVLPVVAAFSVFPDTKIGVIALSMASSTERHPHRQYRIFRREAPPLITWFRLEEDAGFKTAYRINLKHWQADFSRLKNLPARSPVARSLAIRLEALALQYKYQVVAGVNVPGYFETFWAS